MRLDGPGLAQSPGGQLRHATTRRRRRTHPGTALDAWFRTRTKRRRSLRSQELAGAIEHLHYAVFRRYTNQLTRAERSRLDNTIDNALFKIDRYLSRADAAEAARYEDEVRGLRQSIRDGRERLERQVEHGPPRRSQAGPARVALRRVVRGIRRRAVRNAGLRGRAGRRLRRRRGRPPAPPQ